MSSKNKNTIKFAVGTASNPGSHIWRLWVQSNDIYLGAKSSINVYKVSLHASNIWRIAFVQDLKRDDPTKDRLILRWGKPTEIEPGWTPSVGILITSITPAEDFNKVVINDTRIIWINPPHVCNRLLIRVFFSKPGLTEKDLRKFILSSDKLIGFLTKRNNENVWLVAREEPLKQIEIDKVTDVMNKTKIHLKAGSSSDGIHDSRAILITSSDTPSTFDQPTIFDISLGKENIEIDPA